MLTKKRSGLTLIEVLVTIAIISILLSVLLPALGQTKTRAARLRSESNIRSIGQFFAMYAGRNQGSYPAADINRFYDYYIGVHATMGYWQASDYWHVLFENDLRWDEHQNLLLSPGASRLTEAPIIVLPTSSYVYSASFLATPSLWAGTDTSHLMPDDRYRRAAQISHVRYTSRKAMLWEWEMPYLRRNLARDKYTNIAESVPVLFVDGHVDGRIPAEAKEGVLNHDPEATYPFQRLHNTQHGVQGSDY